MTLLQFSSVQYSSSLETSAFHTPSFLGLSLCLNQIQGMVVVQTPFFFLYFFSFCWRCGACALGFSPSTVTMFLRSLLSTFLVINYVSSTLLKRAYVEINLDLSSSSERCIGQEPQAWNPPTLNTHFLSSGIRIHQRHSSFLEFLTSPPRLILIHSPYF